MKMILVLSATVLIALGASSASIFINRKAQAQDNTSPFPRAPHCTNGTASGTYGYRMKGQLVGVGPFLINGIFTHNPDGTMDTDVQLTLGDQSFPAPGTGGTFKTNDDCTGTGKFRVAACGWMAASPACRPSPSAARSPIPSAVATAV